METVKKISTSTIDKWVETSVEITNEVKNIKNSVNWILINDFNPSELELAKILKQERVLLTLHEQFNSWLQWKNALAA